MYPKLSFLNQKFKHHNIFAYPNSQGHLSEDLVEIQKSDAIILDHCVSQLPRTTNKTIKKESPCASSAIFSFLLYLQRNLLYARYCKKKQKSCPWNQAISEMYLNFLFIEHSRLRQFLIKFQVPETKPTRVDQYASRITKMYCMKS